MWLRLLVLQLYEEFMSRSTTRAALAGGNFMGMMNVLMQLRKVRRLLIRLSARKASKSS